MRNQNYKTLIDSTAKAEEALYTGINAENFDEFALAVFRLQASTVPIYKDYLKLLHIHPDRITSVQGIPFIPIQFFKSHKVIQSDTQPELVFESSGTSGTSSSKHFITKPALYEWSYLECIKGFLSLENTAILALLPNYLEKGNSSLVYMVDGLIKKTNTSDSGFFLNNYEDLIRILSKREEQGEKTILWGVAYALLNLCENNQFSLRNTLVLETGGMKGRRKEMTKSELHQALMEGFGTNSICSEYGMTELLSQAYSSGDNIFRTPSHMKVMMRDTTDPFSYVKTGVTGGINIIDLANIYSCSFIATDDIGKLHEDGSFEVLGRFDSAEVRGCNLLVQ